MAMPHFSMRQLLEAGVHFGHHTRRWNPKMAPFIFGVRNGVHIIDLEQTVPMLDHAVKAVRDVAAAGGRVLFVGTKRAASDKVAEAAKRCGQYYVNWKTISQSIKRLREMDDRLTNNQQGLTKKELLMLTRDRDKLERALGGIKDMGGQPDILVVIDTLKEQIAIQEAKVLSVPVVAVCDSNSDPTHVTYPVPGNDDATRAIALYCDLFAGAVLDGLQQEAISHGKDIGEAEEVPVEALPAEAAPEAQAANA
jgi:small subunit ribosomal protein S2